MIRNLVLESDGKYIQLVEYDKTGWTRVLFHDQMITILGADLKNIVIERFLVVFSEESFPKPVYEVDGIKYGGFIALSENHCTGYAAKVGNDILLLFYDVNGEEIGGMKILSEKREEWKKLLKSF